MVDGKGEEEDGGEGDANGDGEAKKRASKRFLGDLYLRIPARMDGDYSWSSCPDGVLLRIRQKGVLSKPIVTTVYWH